MNLYREVVGGSKSLADKIDTDEEVSICYWRKFNALHGYFTRHFCEADDDDLEDMFLSVEDIKNTIELLKLVLRKVSIKSGEVNSGEVAMVYASGDKIKTARGDIITVDELREGDEVDKAGYRFGIKSRGDFESFGDAKMRCIDIESITGKAVGEKTFFVIYAFIKIGQVIENPEICEELFPSIRGPFFGNTEYNEGYLEDVKDTIKKLSVVIKDHYNLVKAGIKEDDIIYCYRAWY